MQERDAQVTKKLMVIETASQRVPMNSCRNGQPYRGSPFSQRVPHIPVCHTGVPMLLGKWSAIQGIPIFTEDSPHSCVIQGSPCSWENGQPYVQGVSILTKGSPYFWKNGEPGSLYSPGNMGTVTRKSVLALP